MTGTLHLFSDSPILSWIGDETLFSLASRYHFFSGNRSARATNIALFGNPSVGRQHDLPAGIDEFCRRTELLLGSPFQICMERTLLRYYAKFMSLEDEQEAVAALCSSTVKGLKYRLGILTSRFRANHPLKACPECIVQDRATTGWACWHMEHQYPGVWVCVAHGQILRESKLKSSGVERFLWHLPDERNFHPTPSIPAGQAGTLSKNLTRLTRLTIDLTESQQVRRLDVSQLYLLYQFELRRRNSLGPFSRLPLSKIAAEFEAHGRIFRHVPELTALPANVDQSYAQLSRYLRCPQGGTHPLRHILMIDWLFGGYDEFLQAYAELPLQVKTSTASSSTVLPQSIKREDNRRKDFATFLHAGELSLTGAAQKIGIDVATALAWAAQLGVAVHRRPKKLKPAQRSALIKQLQLGTDKAEAAAHFQVSVVTITHVLRTEIGLHATWQRVRHESALQAARTRWSALLMENDGLGVKFIRKLEPALYAWLYRNDRPWLSENSFAKRKPTDLCVSRSPWDDRDAVLSAAVAQAALKLAPGLGKKTLKLWHLYQEIPELRAKLSALHRLPQTVRAIDEVLRRGPRPCNTQNFTLPDQ